MKTDQDKSYIFQKCLYAVIYTISDDKSWKDETLESKEKFIKYLKDKKVCSTIRTNWKSKEFKLAVDSVFELLRKGVKYVSK